MLSESQPAAFEGEEAGLCRQTDPEAFYVEKGHSSAPAKRICMACPCRAACLEYALETGQRWGVWGGLSVRERQRLQKRVAA